MRTEVLDDPGALDAIAEDWDRLAVAAGAPFAAPGWLIPWWRHAAPEGARLRVVAVRDGDELIGVGPYFVEREALGITKCTTLGSGASLYVEPVAAAGRREDVAREIAGALASLDPVPDYLYFDGIYEASPWRGLIARAWPGRGCWWHAPMRMPAPFIDASARSYDEWFSSKSKNFREQTKRKKKKLVKEGATFRMSAPDEVEADVVSFARLHHARWDTRGGSSVMTVGVQAMLPKAAALIGTERFRLWSIDVDGKTISSHLFVEAGGMSAYWLGGFDPEWGAHQPAMQTLIAAIEDGWRNGDTRVDLGAGGQDYKYRLSDGEVPVVWGVLVPRSPRMWLVRARLGPYHLKRAALNRTPPEVKERIKSLLRRGSS